MILTGLVGSNVYTKQPDLFQDVADFHEKFELPRGGKAHLLDENAFDFRLKFLLEEITELIEGQKTQDVAKAADALVDLVYVALGTAVMMGVPFNECWAVVQEANMAKVRATGAADPLSKRKHKLDVVKPAGWTPPDIQKVLDEQVG